MHVNNNYLVTLIYLKDANNISGVRVTIDTLIENTMNMILSDGTVFKFEGCGLGLYYSDISSTDEHNSAKTNAIIFPYSLLSTVTKNK